VSFSTSLSRRFFAVLIVYPIFSLSFKSILIPAISNSGILNGKSGILFPRFPTTSSYKSFIVENSGVS
jgi:hypothetical protein